MDEPGGKERQTDSEEARGDKNTDLRKISLTLRSYS